MLTSFWESVGKGLSERGLGYLFGPAFLFWAGGLLLWLGPKGLPRAWQRLTALPAVSQGALLVGALLVLAASGRLMDALSLPLLRLLEGYWLPPLDRAAAWRARKRQKAIARRKARWSALMLKRDEAGLTWREARELARLEGWRLHTPRDAADVMPTRLGEILRAAETRPRQRYGLDPVLLWPLLWPLLPEALRHDLDAARARMDALAAAWGWGLLFAVWARVSPWALAVAVVWMAAAYALLVQSALPFADLLMAAFDTHRWRLYEALRWPLPAESGQAEIAAGQALTRFVQRGIAEQPVAFTPLEK